jgi:predicted DNA-binding protein with PD1-like motif
MYKKVHAFRVKPKQELFSSIVQYCGDNNITSGIIIGIIGSVEKARLNFIVQLPGKYEGVDYTGPLEIVCAQGSVARKDNEVLVHVHVQLSGRDICSGGHLVEAIIYSSAEVIIGELDYQLYRQYDSYTGLNELSA